MLQRACAWALLLALMVLPAAVQAGERPVLRLGLLKFGTVNWEIDTIRHHGLDRQAGLDLQVVELANPEAGKIALMGNSVDMIVSDWLWASRQRHEGTAISFLPYSSAVGALVAGRDSGIRSLADLRGRRIGVAGGPLDKSWLLLRGLARQDHGLDLAGEAVPVFAAPPLLNQQLEDGRLDAVLQYWHYAARLEAREHKRLIDVGEIGRRLGVAGDAPALGYVFRDAWGRAHPEAVLAFFQASLAAKDLLRHDDAEWDRLRPLIRAEDEATFIALRDGYRAGIPSRWGASERDAAAQLYELLARLGGPALVGAGPALAAGTFWPEAHIPAPPPATR